MNLKKDETHVKWGRAHFFEQLLYFDTAFQVQLTKRFRLAIEMYSFVF